MNITIIGGGNIGTLMAAEFAHKGHNVTVYTSKPSHWQKKICVYDSGEKLLLKSELAVITDSIQEAVENAEYIWIATPAQCFSVLSGKILPYVRQGQKIGVVPGGGAEFAFCELLQKGCVLFGLQRVHSIARLKEYGKAVYELGRKSELHIGAIPSSNTADICSMVSKLFDINCIAIENYLAVTLTPSNQILHTTRIYSMFKEYTSTTVYPKNFLFYEEWTDDASKMLIACDQELQDICEVIPLNLSSVKSLKEHYESWAVEEMTKKISGIKAFKGLTSPMKYTGEGWIPDWNSRYFATDFSFGLKVIKDIAKIVKTPTPSMDIIWNWYIETVKPDKRNIFSMQFTFDEFLEIYR